MRKNIAGQKWLAFAFVRATGAPVTGDAANITGQVRKDFGTATTLATPNPAEVSLGYYEFSMSQAETNADVLDLICSSATTGVQVIAVDVRQHTESTSAELVESIASSVVTLLNGIRLTIQQQLTISGSLDLAVIQGDDYTRAGVRIDLDTSGMDDPMVNLSTYKLIAAAQSTPRIVVRMDIDGSPGAHYATFNPPSSLTEDWPEGRFNLLYRVEWAANEYETIGEQASLTVSPFDIAPGEIVDL